MATSNEFFNANQPLSANNIGLPERDLAAMAPLPGGAPATDLMQRVVKGAHETIDSLAESAKPGIQRLGEGVASAGQAVQANAEKLLEVRDEWTGALRNTVREHPLTTLAAAVAIGALLARFTR